MGTMLVSQYSLCLHISENHAKLKYLHNAIPSLNTLNENSASHKKKEQRSISVHRTSNDSSVLDSVIRFRIKINPYVNFFKPHISWKGWKIL